ncbi:Uma2 family endonuclease [Leptolyngbya sp. PCC 6406]|uniref:Uma2 family endonuclease n=1 Tax=Leptolyngbya sp. PCC 6406 TaxID=1173264 RepID=UPI0002ACE304|nr:Uma2 family endonuclease [Leptolyngbya sp. PCC 6406]
MAETTGLISDPILYPDSDGQPMTESDATRDYLLYCVEVLRLYFKGRSNVYVSGNLFVYYEEGNPKAAISPDVFVIFGVSNRKRRSYKTWQEGGKLPNFVLEVTSRSTKRQDEVEKPRLYASLGVQEYFQYDPTADYLNPQLRGAQLVDGTYQPLPLASTAAGLPYIHSAVLGLDLQLHPPYPELGLAPAAQALRFYDPQTGTKLLSRDELEQLREALQEENGLIQQDRDAAQQERDAAQQERDAAQQRAETLAARLRELGIDPE